MLLLQGCAAPGGTGLAVARITADTVDIAVRIASIEAKARSRAAARAEWASYCQRLARQVEVEQTNASSELAEAAQACVAQK